MVAASHAVAGRKCRCFPRVNRISPSVSGELADAQCESRSRSALRIPLSVSSLDVPRFPHLSLEEEQNSVEGEAAHADAALRRSALRGHARLPYGFGEGDAGAEELPVHLVVLPAIDTERHGSTRIPQLKWTEMCEEERVSADFWRIGRWLGRAG